FTAIAVQFWSVTEHSAQLGAQVLWWSRSSEKLRHATAHGTPHATAAIAAGVREITGRDHANDEPVTERVSPSSPAFLEHSLARLGVRRMLLAIHDVSFPADADEDTGRGGPATRAAARLLAYVRLLGFTGIQLGPQGQTARDNPSPYDGTIFSRHLGNIALGSLRPGGAFEGLVGDAELARAVLAAPGGPAP